MADLNYRFIITQSNTLLEYEDLMKIKPQRASRIQNSTVRDLDGLFYMEVRGFFFFVK